MGVLDKLLKIAGKEDFQIDSSIGTGYIIRQCWKYGWMMIRGKVFSLGNRQIANSIFVGKNVKVIETSIRRTYVLPSTGTVLFMIQINELPKVTSWESIHTNQYQIKLSQLSLYADKMYIHTSSLLLR